MEKIKQFIESEKGKDILTIFIVIFVGTGSFFLGRLSKVQNSGIKVEYPANYQTQANLSQIKTNTGQNTTSSGQQAVTANTGQVPPLAGQAGNFFASSRGHKYYSLGCSAGKTIKQENRIYFATSTDAEKAGYTLSSSCQ